jgi:hypothetical protein
LDGRFRQVHAAHLLEQFGALLEAGSDGTRQTGQTLDGRGDVMSRDASVVIKGALAFAATAAVIVGTLVGDRTEQADDGALGVIVVRSSIVAAGASYTGAFVAVFF